MAEQLATVAYSLIKDAGSQGNNADRRRTSSRNERIEKLMKDEIDKFHEFLVDRKKRENNDQATVTFKNVLEDAEKRGMNDKEVKNWLVKVKDVYYRVIDVCQELRNEENRKPGQCKLQIRDSILQMADKISKKIKDLKDDNVKSKLGDEPNSGNLSKQPLTLVHDEEDEMAMKIYGREEEKFKLKARIYHSSKEVKVVCILGVTGIGKSALAQEVYKEVKNDFELAAFVNVFAEFDHLGIARDFVESVNTSKKLTNTDLESLAQKVDDRIKGKRYLLVLDGLRDDEKDLKPKWDKLMAMFKSGGDGCTILMTTNQENEIITKTSPLPYNLKLQKLPDEVCWSIIVGQAFGVNHSTIIKDILEIIYDSFGKELEKKCEGLPVIAKALGSVLRDRTLLKDWEQVLRSDLWELAPKEKPAMKATMLSYQFLPPDLKQCLLYCSIFPKNHNIDVDQLVSLWMAQDCIGFDQKKSMEAEGWRRFKELLDRSIFQDYTPQGDSSGSFQFKLQGAMSDFVHELAEEECHTMRPADENMSTTVRHCMVNVLPQDSMPETIPKSENLHTLKVLSEYSSIDPANLSNLLSQMRRLRALVLSYCSMKKLPPKACELLHLRYLDLSFNRDLKKLPEEICNLYNLQTLNLNGCDELQELPKNIGKLTKLRHLDILWTQNLSFLPKGLTKLVSLKRLSRFFGASDASNNNKACNLSDMKHLNNLQGYIAIEGLGVGKSASSEAQTAELKKKEHIIGLELWFSVVGSEESKNYHEDVLKVLAPPSKLECLGIFDYRGKSFFEWILEMENLKHLILSDCSKCDTLPGLGKLQKLETLEIKNLSNVKQVSHLFLGGVEKIAFPKLKKLCFQKLDSWESWDCLVDDGKGHMPELTFMLIESCLKLKTLPNFVKRKIQLQDTSLPDPKILWPDPNPKPKKTSLEAQPEFHEQ